VTGLLVSVRNAKEARLAWRAGADIIDVKEPQAGPLGRAGPQVWRQVAGLLPRGAAMSVALGELADYTPGGLAELPELARWVKLGPAGLGANELIGRWEVLGRDLPAHAALVAVAYADSAESSAPAPKQVLAGASAAGLSTLLIDTAFKDGRTLVDHISPEELAKIIGEARERGIACALAGSLTAELIATLLDLRPDWFAVRGAVCRGNREGQVEARCVTRLRKIIDRRSTI